MDSDSPHIVRPVPRRPFDLNGAREPTPPPSDGGEDSPGPQQHNHLGIQMPPRQTGLPPSSTFSSLASEDSTAAGSDISRETSFLNLQKSTLFGIYQAQGPDSPSVDRLDNHLLGGPGSSNGAGGAGNSSPWGSGAETPLVRRPGVSDAMFEIMRSRRSGDASQQMDAEFDPGSRIPETTPTWDAVNVLFRLAVLFGLGVGYGTLMGKLGISRSVNESLFKEGSDSPAGSDETDAAGWAHSLFWGFGGVVIAALLPWFDRAWEAKFGPTARVATGLKSRRKSNSDKGRPPMDWTLVLRPIAAFLGIVFAIRKLAWTSTMQVSLYLAVVNPFLWYLIDRSKTGFLLSAAFSTVSSAVLMGLDPDLMPVPSLARSPLRNATRAVYHDRGDGSRGRNLLSLTAAASSSVAARLPSDETVEKALWMASVLFCSCLVFGNIGRRMGLERGAYTRGRWAGAR